MIYNIEYLIRKYGINSIYVTFPTTIWWLRNNSAFKNLKSIKCILKRAEQYPEDLMVCPLNSKVAHIYSYKELDNLFEQNLIGWGIN